MFLKIWRTVFELEKIFSGKELGQGEFGAVYEAEWKKPGAAKNVSLKWVTWTSPDLSFDVIDFVFVAKWRRLATNTKSVTS